jgi:hypothetical protein
LAGAAAARKLAEEARETKRTHDRAYMTLKKQQAKLKPERDSLKRDRAALEAEKQTLAGNLQHIFRGNGAQVLDGLRMLSGGRDPVKLVEELNIAVLGKKPANQGDPELRQELAETRQQLMQFIQHQQIQQQSTRLAQTKQQLAQHANNAQRWPMLARYANDNPANVAEAATEILTEAHTSGQHMTWDDACAELENQLADHARRMGFSPAPGGQAPTAPSGQNPEVGRAPNGNPGQAQRAPGQSLTSQRVAAPSSQRDMTDEEQLDAMSKDPVVLRQLGFG